MTDVLTCRKEGAVAHLFVDRAERGNMLTLGMLDELSALIREAGQDPAIKAISIRTAGAGFCLGRDPQSSPESTPKDGVEMRSALAMPVTALRSCAAAETCASRLVRRVSTDWRCTAKLAAAISDASRPKSTPLPAPRAEMIEEPAFSMPGRTLWPMWPRRAYPVSEPGLV